MSAIPKPVAAYPSPVRFLGMGIGQARTVLQQATAALREHAHGTQIMWDGELVDSADIVDGLNQIEQFLYWEHERTREGGIPR